jgi:hypothetical protein
MIHISAGKTVSLSVYLKKVDNNSLSQSSSFSFVSMLNSLLALCEYLVRLYTTIGRRNYETLSGGNNLGVLCQSLFMDIIMELSSR